MEYCKNDNIRDHLIYVIICTEDNTILTQKIADGVKCEHFMISTTLREDEGWNAAGRKLANQVGNQNCVLVCYNIINNINRHY